MTGGPAVAVEGLVKRYGARTVVDGVSLEVRAGELVALPGPNGAGKTTTVETIEGYRRPDRDPDELVEVVGLGAVKATPYRRLSGGERQRLSLAVALVGRPDVLLLDEPTAGLDPEARIAVRGLVADVRAGGAAILLTSHDLTDVERLADRTVIIVEGKVVAAGTPAELMARAGSAIRFRLGRALTPNEIESIERRLRSIAGLADVSIVSDGEASRYRVDVEASRIPNAVAALAGGAAEIEVAIAELRTGGGSLEDAYLAMVGREGAA